MTEKLTEEEHIARAMLMGMRYHHGNGEPFYFTYGDDGVPDVLSFVDADTLKPLATKGVHDEIILSTLKTKRQHNAIWRDWGKGIKP